MQQINNKNKQNMKNILRVDKNISHEKELRRTSPDEGNLIWKKYCELNKTDANIFRKSIEIKGISRYVFHRDTLLDVNPEKLPYWRYKIYDDLLKLSLNLAASQENESINLTTEDYATE